MFLEDVRTCSVWAVEDLCRSRDLILYRSRDGWNICSIQNRYDRAGGRKSSGEMTRVSRDFVDAFFRLRVAAEAQE